MALIPTLTQIISGDADDPSRDMSNWNTIRNVVNGQLDNVNIATGADINISKTNLATTNLKTAMYVQRENSGGGAVDTLISNQVIQRGYFWIQGNGTPSIDHNIVFPVAYDDVEWDCVINYFGTDINAPAIRNDQTTLSLAGFHCPILSATRSVNGFTVRCFTWNSANTDAAVWYLLSYIVIGTKA